MSRSGRGLRCTRRVAVAAFRGWARPPFVHNDARPQSRSIAQKEKVGQRPPLREDAKRLARSRRPGTKAPAAPGYGLAAGALAAGRKM